MEKTQPHSLRFTLADDDDNFLYLMHHLLSQAFPGSSVASFSNAEDALPHVLNSGTDFLITNHGMGTMSGTDLIKELRQRKVSLPIIMVSGNEAAEKEAIEAGATEFLHKDFVPKKLAQRVRHYLSG